MKEIKTLRTKNIMMIGFVILILVALIGVTVAAFLYQKAGTKENVVQTGTLVMTIGDSSSAEISLANAIPTSDSDGLLTTPTSFVIKNTGTANSSYQLSLVEDTQTYTNDGCSSNKLPASAIKYSITKNSGTAVTNLLSTNNYIIDSGTLNSGSSNSYDLRIWIDYNAGNEIMGKHFHGKLKLDAIVSGNTNYDTGA